MDTVIGNNVIRDQVRSSALVMCAKGVSDTSLHSSIYYNHVAEPPVLPPIPIYSLKPSA